MNATTTATATRKSIGSCWHCSLTQPDYAPAPAYYNTYYGPLCDEHFEAYEQATASADPDPKWRD